MDERIDPPPGATARAWRRLGEEPALLLESARVLQVVLPFLRPVTTAIGVHRQRPLVLVHLVCRTADGSTVEGWGECAALADTMYDVEDVESAFTSLRDDLVPDLAGAAVRRGTLPSVGSLPGTVLPGDRPLAWSALEMAVGDVHLRAAERSFADVLGVSGSRIAPGAVLGLPTSTDALLADLGRLEAAGYARVKVKVAPGIEHVLVDALRARADGGIPVQVDANGAYGSATLDELDALDGLGFLCIEQPLDRDDLEGHRALADRLTTPVCLDESVCSPGRVVEAVTSGACSVVCVKPARLGGIAAALDVIDWCTSTGVPWWMGGMFESGFGRRVLTALAALPGAGLPGDLAPASTYLAADLVGPPDVSVDPGSGRLLIAVHGGPGVAPAPDAAVVNATLVRHAQVPVPPG
jgi:O-succinylbenzoate synthase